MTDAEKIAAFFASKGATKVPTGASHGISDRQWYAASQGRIDLRSKLNGSEAERRAENEAQARFEHRYLRSQGEAEFDEAGWTRRMAGDLDG